MQKTYRSLLAVFIIILTANGCSSQTSPGLQRVIIIRHAEKPDKGDNLSCKGFNRSLQLPSVLYNKFKIPGKIFIPAVGNGKSANQVRMLQTITPFAIKYSINVDSKYDVDDVKSVAAAILKTNGYALVVWEHARIDNIARALGVDTKGMKWDDNDFDSIWIIDFKNGKATLSTDKENLNPANNCQ